MILDTQGLDGSDPIVQSDPGVPQVAGLDSSRQAVLDKLWRLWSSRRARNALLDVYYDGHRSLQDLGISVPPQMTRVRAALAWPFKAVQSLARKHVFEGFSLDGDTDPFDLSSLLAHNSFDLELSQGITSAYKHCCSFITCTLGDPSAGDPEVVLQARDALWSAALWDRRRRQISAALTITDVSKDAPSAAVLYLPDDVIALERGAAGNWVARSLGNPTGRVLVEPLVYDPQLSRPLGRSRISREVRYLTDAAIRTMVRAETSAEFFASPQRYALGVDPEAFDDMDRWSAVMGRLQVLTVNENGDAPSVGQFPQSSMSPHWEMYRQLAQNLCAATNMPQSMVGLFADNPASAEAMQAAEYALSDEAEFQWRVFAPALRRVAQNAVMLRDGLSEPPAESWDLQVRWTPARYVSPAAASDYITKIVQALPQVADTTVALRKAGFTQPEIEEMEAQHERRRAPSVLETIMAGVRTGEGAPGVPVAGDTPSVGALAAGVTAGGDQG